MANRIPTGSESKNPLSSEVSLRDYFAAKAMQGIYASPDLVNWTYDMVAQAAYRQADVMLRARQSVPTS